MNLFVDTSAWSLTLRRDRPSSEPQVQRLVKAIRAGETIISTGLILQEILQGFSGPRQRNLILEHFSAVPLLVPERDDHIEAADLGNQCRRKGVQVGTVDALLAQLCIRHNLTMLSADQDFDHMARHCALKVWKQKG
jgi:predicted nucleic acid-binding protein